MNDLLTKDLLDSIGELPAHQRPGVMRELMSREFRRCAEDPLYWLDVAKHPALAYVYTQDKRPIYSCNLCMENDPDKYGDWTHGKSRLESHLNNHHDMATPNHAFAVKHFTLLDYRRIFTVKEYMPAIIEFWEKEKLLAIQKSRDMMATHLIVALFTWDVLFHRGRQHIFQSQKAAPTLELVKDRAYFIYEQQPAFFKRIQRAEFKIGTAQSGVMTAYGMGGEIIGFPQGPDHNSQYHPAGIFIDEAAYQEKGGDAVGAAKMAIQEGGKIVLLSSANPGWFQGICEDRSDD